MCRAQRILPAFSLLRFKVVHFAYSKRKPFSLCWILLFKMAQMLFLVQTIRCVCLLCAHMCVCNCPLDVMTFTDHQ